MHKISKRTILLLITLIGAVSVVILRQYIFGDRLFVFDDIGSDTLQLYLQLYSSIIHHIQELDFSFWDLENGFGTNMFLYNLTNPILMLLYLIGTIFGTEVIPYLMVWVYLGELILNGVCAYLFLSMFRFSEKSKLIASFMYAFNGFAVVWGQHYQFGILCILLPLELIFVERYLRNHKAWKGLTIMTMIVVFNSMYMAYMILLFSGLYVLVRELYENYTGFLSYVKRVIQTALTMLLGVGLGGISLIPSAMAILKVSSRLSSGQSILSRLLVTYPRIYFVTLFNRTLNTVSRGINIYDGYSNYYEGPTLFFSTLFLFLVLQYVFLLPKMDLSRRKKIIQVFVLLGCISGIILPYFGIIMNAFVGAFCRFFFLYMIYFAYLSAAALEEMMTKRRISRIGFLLSLLYVLRFSYTSYYGVLPNSKNPIIALLATGLFMALCLILLSKKKLPTIIKQEKVQNAVFVLLLLSLAANVASDMWKNVDANSMTQISFSRLAAQKNGDYMNRMYDRDTLDAIAYLKEQNPSFYRMEKMYGATFSMDGLGQNYASVGTYNSTMNGNIAGYVERYWPELYYNDPNHLSFAAGEAYKNSEQMSLMGIRYLLVREGDPVSDGYEFLQAFGDVQVYVNEGVGSIASFYTAFEQMEDTVEVNYPNRDQSAEIQMLYPKKDGTISADITVNEKGVLFTAIPYESGWTAYVDGVEVKQLRANEGFVGLEVSEGSHSVLLQYEAPGLKIGALLSVVSLIIYLLLILIRKRNFIS